MAESHPAHKKGESEVRPEEIEWRQGEGAKPHAVRAGEGASGQARGLCGAVADGPMRRKEMRCKKCLQILKAMERWENAQKPGKENS
jgi:hypothetical protein